MARLEPRYSKEEFARRGEEIFERVIRARVEGEDERKFVLIDIETEDYEVDSDKMAASNRLLGRNPDGQVWARRVGSRFVYSFGGSQFRRSADD